MAKTKKTNTILLALLAGLILRIIFLYPQFSGDVRNHIVWADYFLKHSKDFFNTQPPGFNTPNYPPVAIYLFAISRLFYEAAKNLSSTLNSSIALFPSQLVHLFPTLNMQAAFMKLPAVFADLGITYLIYLFTKDSKNKHAKFLPYLYLFNPAFIYISAVWGQIESIPLFFLLLSLYFGIKQKNIYLSASAFTLAILSKQTALWVTPVYLIIWQKEFKTDEIIKSALFQIALFILLYLPFVRSISEPFTTYLDTLKGSSLVVSDAAWNIWYFITNNPSLPDSTLLGPLSIRTWSLIFLFSTYTYLLYLLYKNYNQKNVMDTLFLLSLAAFFLQTRVHDRHLAPALLFLILTIPHKNHSQVKFVIFVFLTIFHYANLFYSLKLPFL